MYKKSILIFRRDLRLEDHTALINAIKFSENVIFIFIFTKEQVLNNQYRSNSALQYMIISLQELAKKIEIFGSKLYFFYGNYVEIIEKLLNKNSSIEAIFSHYDYTPYAKERDKKIKLICNQFSVDYNLYHDYVLSVPGSVLTKEKTPYKIFTFFYNQAIKLPILDPSVMKIKGLNSVDIDLQDIQQIDIFEELTEKGIFLLREENFFLRGGREEAKILLENIFNLINYQKDRDFPFLKTSKLSAINKFGTLSIREVSKKIISLYGKDSILMKEIYWRDFFIHIAYYFPNVFEGAFNEKYNQLDWNNSELLFQKWCEGKTGFPIVDAGMRELNKTGWMHNRVRMITASFLVKDLGVDWRKGEKYFAQKLIDYDPSVNNGNWQWVASTGCDSQPYFRIFNPWMQQKKYDPDCLYIKKWIPELINCSSLDIHSLYIKKISTYPEPCIDHALESKKTVLKYKSIK